MDLSNHRNLAGFGGSKGYYRRCLLSLLAAASSRSLGGGISGFRKSVGLRAWCGSEQSYALYLFHLPAKVLAWRLIEVSLESPGALSWNFFSVAYLNKLKSRVTIPPSL